MFSTARDVAEYLRIEKVQAVDLKFTELTGRWHHLTLPAARVDERALREGVGFDGSSMPGFKTVEAGDMTLLPDPTSAFFDPFFDDRTLSLVCDVVEAGSLEPYPRCPRGIARRAEARLRETGVADEARFGPEFEFNLIDRVSYRNDTCTAFAELGSREGRFGGGDGSHHGVTIPPKGGYHAIPPGDAHYKVRGEMVRLLEQAQVQVRYHHHEVGSLGQQEIEVYLQGPTRSADVVMLVKYFVKMVARAHGLVATFMPKPFYGEAGNGMHFHQHCFRGGEPVFHDPRGYGGLGRVGLAWVGGLLDHAAALLALTNPSTNSFRRLVPGYEAPVNAFFSVANRSAAIRIPKYATAPEEVRIEFRPPDATCNPYLAVAAMLLAGADGVERDVDPTAAGYGPHDRNVFDQPEAERRERIRPLPASLDEALQALRRDADFLRAGNVFDSALVDDWIAIKSAEAQAVRLRPHPFEIERLLDC